MSKAIAIVGAGPAGLLCAHRLLANDNRIRLSIYESLDQPFGLARFGVAPDHPATKNIITRLTPVLDHARLYLNAPVADTPLSSAQAQMQDYSDIIWATGPARARMPDIAGRDWLIGGFDFARWANQHPLTRGLPAVLAAVSRHRRAIIIGAGNVAIDCARMLLRTPEEYRRYALSPLVRDWLSDNRFAQVIIVVRKSPARTRFTPAELRELTTLPDRPAGVFAPATAEAAEGTGREARIRARVSEMLDALPHYADLGSLLSGPARLGFVFGAEPVCYADGGLTLTVDGDSHVIKSQLVIAATGYVPTALPQSLDKDRRIRLCGWIAADCRGALIDTQQQAYKLADSLTRKATA